MKTFHPFMHEDVPASSPPHAENTVYRVSIGIEYWEQGPEEVIKVQMVYDGVVSGRRSPSFPSGTDDFARVVEAIERLEDRAKHLPMTAERFRAFRSDSPAADSLRKEVKEESIKRIVSRLKNKPAN